MSLTSVDPTLASNSPVVFVIEHATKGVQMVCGLRHAAGAYVAPRGVGPASGEE